MAMDRIENNPLIRQGQVERFQNAERGARPEGADQTGQSVRGGEARTTADTAEISTTARDLVDLRLAVDVGRAALSAEPDVRAERVAEARERLATGFYNSDRVRDAVAEKVGGVLGAMDLL